jgi:hypothetical protein
MTFPTTAILDNFNRTNGEVGSNWTQWGSGTPSIVSNCLAASAGSEFNMYWNPSTFGPNCEVYITDTDDLGEGAVLELRLYARLSNPGSSLSGYAAIRQYQTGDWYIVRLDNGSWTQLGSVISNPGAEDGRAFGLEVNDNIITLYTKTPGGSWTAIGSVTDYTYTNAGHIAMAGKSWSGNVLYDDFGGGTVITTIPGQPTQLRGLFVPGMRRFCPGFGR